MLILPLIYLLSHIGVLFLDIWLYRIATRRFNIKRRFITPFLLVLFLWPTIALFWLESFSSRGDYIRVEGFWYTFNTQQFLANFIYNQLGPFETGALLGLIDVLILGTLICIPIYLIVLIRLWWIK